MGDIVCQRFRSIDCWGVFYSREAAFRDIYVSGRLEDDCHFAQIRNCVQDNGGVFYAPVS